MSNTTDTPQYGPNKKEILRRNLEREKDFCKRHENCLKNCPYFKEKFRTKSNGKKTGWHSELSHCDYLCMTGHRRNVDPSECTHYKDKIKVIMGDYCLYKKAVKIQSNG